MAMPNRVGAEVVAYLRRAGRPVRCSEIAAAIGRSPSGVYENLCTLSRAGTVRRVGRVLAGRTYVWTYALCATGMA
jgi:DNA-binding IclR family transcriptional regulator